MFSYSVSWKLVWRTGKKKKKMSKGGLQSRQQLPCRAGSFLIRVSETQEDQAIVYRDSKEFITHRYRHRPIRSAVPLFPGGRNRGGGGKQHTRAETRPDSSSSGSGVGRPRKKRTELWARGLCQKRQAK